MAREARVRRLPPEARREQIVAAVLDVVAEYGVPEATIARIAKAADVSEGTLYVYFASRKEMLLAALESILREMYQLIDGSDGKDALERLRDDRGSALPADERRARPSRLSLVRVHRGRASSGHPRRRCRHPPARLPAPQEDHRGRQSQGDHPGRRDADRLAWGFYTVLWAENIACMMGMREYLDEGHSAHILNLILSDAAS